MVDGIVKVIGSLSAEMWMYVLAGLIVVTFLVLLVVILVAGDINQFKKAAKIVIGSPDAKHANTAAKKMPVKVTKLYKRCRATGEKPGDVIGIDAAVYTPYYTSAAARFAPIVAVVAIFSSLLMQAIVYIVLAEAADAEQLLAGYVAMAVIAAVGLIFCVLAYIISACFLKGAVKTYDKYIAALDTMSGNGGFEHISLDDAAQTAPAASDAPARKTSRKAARETAQEAAESQESAHQESAHIVYTDAVSYPAAAAETEIVYEPNAQEFTFHETTTVTETETSYTPVERVVPQKEEPVIIAPPPPSPAPEPVVASEPVLSYPAQNAAELRARAEQARAERAARAAEQAAAEPQGVTGSADEVIKKIEKASSEGAPLSTMKEIAIQLQQERQKPENKTPEMAKRLSDAQVMLIKAMSSAMRR